MAYLKLSICVVAIFIGLTSGPVQVSCHKFPPPPPQRKGPPAGMSILPLPIPRPFPIRRPNEERRTVLLVEDNGFDNTMGGLLESLLPLLAIPLLCK